MKIILRKKMKFWNNLIKITVLVIFISIFYSSCAFNNGNNSTFGYLVTVDTGIEAISSNTSIILMKTKDGCSVTGFNLKSDYYTEKLNENIFIASTIEELKIMQEKYFDLPYLDTFSIEYFEENYLVFILVGYSASSDLKNEKIKKENGKYIFSVERWWKPAPPPGAGYALCAIIGLFLLQIQKN
jgi:hypothetical protein